VQSKNENDDFVFENLVLSNGQRAYFELNSETRCEPWWPPPSPGFAGYPMMTRTFAKPGLFCAPHFAPPLLPVGHL